DVRKHINLPVLSKLPRRPDTDRSLLDISPRSAFAEQFSTLATLVRSYAKELSIRSLLVTSAVKEEGKTDIACNLSIALARKGLRVLLIDADFHRSMVSKFFHVNVERGSMNYVESAGATDLANYVTPSPAEGLDLLGAGGSVADPVRLIESERFRQMLKQAEAEYDLVVIDSPPVARVGDALIIASEVDATVFVVSSGDVTFADAALAKRLLTNVQANLLGVILNNSRDTRAREYYNYYYEGTRRRVRRVVD
ncbi:MAG: CpsD/CapB family tyrosine-protein kinase, partial [Planctomycetes bacterium]|nr:CpsD/CapB family tyrosine-protein kinase [Planctomycetota bacterium]